MISVVDTVHQQSCSKPKPGTANEGWTDVNTEHFLANFFFILVLTLSVNTVPHWVSVAEDQTPAL